jgi:signal transduction histidine kinase/ActR/RegA family two-component response regulator
MMRRSSGVPGGDDRSPEVPPDIEDRLRLRQIDVLYDQTPVALVASIAAALILVGFFWAITPGPVLFLWFALLLLVTAFRGALVYRYRCSEDKQERANYWLNWFIAGSLTSALIWDTTIILFPPEGAIVHVGLAVLWVCGLTAGSVAALSSIKGAFFSFAFPALVPAAIYLLFTGGRMEVTIAGALFLFLGFLTLNALSTHRTVKQSLRLEFENSNLIAHLDAEKERIEKLNDQLEKRVAERTDELVAANAAKSRFLAAASHDLRQPLQTLSLLTGVLSRTVSDPQPTETVQELQDTIVVMGGLLDALLDISKLDSGAITPEATEFSIGAMLQRLYLAFRHHAIEKGLSLHIVPSSVIVCSDPVVLENIVRNLLSNAIRYTDKGKVLLGCRRRGSKLRIEVWDTGIGIPKEQVNRIFEEYYQLNNPARDRGKGLGLGLAIVERSSRLLGYRVDVHSVRDQGSVFAVEVPIGKVASQYDITPAVNPLSRDEYQQVSVVLVDDERAVLEATQIFLEIDGFQVYTASSGEEALQKIQDLEIKPDLIIADYRLPQNMTGIEVVRHIRELMNYVAPGIILTGDVSPELTREAQDNGLQVLHKPADPEALLAMIYQLLAGDKRPESTIVG